MSNAIRLVNGGSIQVRTGVLQGIGPQGPRGVSGPAGADGPQGLQGDTGAMGQILAMMSKTSVGSSNPLAANTDTVVSWGSVAYDDLSCFSSVSNITLTNAGDYLFTCYLRFDAGVAGLRQVWYSVNGSTIIRATRSSWAGTATFVDVSFAYRAAAGDVLNVLARSDIALNIGQGSLTVNRIGSGPQGVAGPQGPQGSVGPTGAKGDKGDAGSASSGFAHYSDLLPH